MNKLFLFSSRFRSGEIPIISRNGVIDFDLNHKTIHTDYAVSMVQKVSVLSQHSLVSRKNQIYPTSCPWLKSTKMKYLRFCELESVCNKIVEKQSWIWSPSDLQYVFKNISYLLADTNRGIDFLRYKIVRRNANIIWRWI